MKAAAILLAAALAAGCSRQSASTLLENTAAQDAVAKVVAKIPAPARIFSIEIKPTEVIILAQAASAPGHVDEFRFQQLRGVAATLGSERISGPQPAKPVLLNPRLEENLFHLADVNLAAVAQTAQEAVRRVALEGGGAVQSIRIQRRAGLLPEPHSGEVGWDIAVTGPRESASARADAQGRIVGLDLSGTRRAATVDFVRDREALAEAVATLRTHFGADRVFYEISIATSRLGLLVRDPANSGETLEYSCDLSGIAKTLAHSAGIKMPHQSARPDMEFFSIDDADWSRVPALGQAALEKVPIPGARVFDIELRRRSHMGAEQPAHWRVHVIKGLMGEAGFASFDARSGALTRVELPASLVPPADFLKPENTRRLLGEILEDIGPAARMIDLSINADRASVGATTAKHPAELRRYGYSAQDRAAVASPTPTAVEDRSVRDGLFDAAELQAIAPRIEELRKNAFQRLGMPDGKLERLTFFRKSPFYPTPKTMLIEMRCSSPTVGEGRILYDTSGKEFDIVTP